MNDPHPNYQLDSLPEPTRTTSFEHNRGESLEGMEPEEIAEEFDDLPQSRLENYLHYDHPKVRQQASHTLLERFKQMHRQQLMVELKSPDEKVRQLAVRALQFVKTEQQVEAATERQEQVEQQARRRVQERLEKLQEMRDFERAEHPLRKRARKLRDSLHANQMDAYRKKVARQNPRNFRIMFGGLWRWFRDLFR